MIWAAYASLRFWCQQVSAVCSEDKVFPCHQTKNNVHTRKQVQAQLQAAGTKCAGLETQVAEGAAGLQSLQVQDPAWQKSNCLECFGSQDTMDCKAV
jgi:hypothetical protein